MKHAIVLGSEGRLGRAFCPRLTLEGFHVSRLRSPTAWSCRPSPDVRPLLFDFAYADDPCAHVERVVQHFEHADDYGAIFVPSSWWIGTDTAYGRAKLVIEQLAALYRGFGAKICTDRVGYFPGENVLPDRSDRFFDKLVTADELYARVMAGMRELAGLSLNGDRAPAPPPDDLGFEDNVRAPRSRSSFPRSNNVEGRNFVD